MSETLGTATQKRIVDLLNDYRNGVLVLRPRFQRNLVWNTAHKAAFIETILNSYPFPEVYFCDGIMDIEEQKTTTWVVDGQQRLNTIFDYINGLLDLSKHGIQSFSQLSNEKKHKFLGYIVVVRSLGSITEEETKKIFQRINSVGYALNSIEVDNALYEGSFISVAKEIAQYEDFKKLEILTDQEISRMKDVEFCLLIMASVENGIYFTQDKELEETIKRFDDEYPNQDNMKQAMMKAITFLNQLLLPYDSIWYKKTSMFSLITEFAKHYLKNPNAVLDSHSIETKLKTLEDKITQSKLEDPEKNTYAKYYKHTFQQTTSRTGRMARATVISEVFS